MSNPQHLSVAGGYRNTMAHYAPQHAATVVRDWHPLRRQLATGAMSVMLVSAMMVPNAAFAADWVDYDGNGATEDAIDTDTFKWGGKGTDDIYMNGYEGGSILIGGDANISVEGESVVKGDIAVSDGDLVIAVADDVTVNGNVSVSGGDLTITGDDAVYGEDKPSITLTREDKSGSGYNNIFASGDIDISDVNITFDNEGYENDDYHGSVFAGAATWNSETQQPDYKEGNIAITNSKIAAKDVKDDSTANAEYDYSMNTVAITALGELGIKESVIDANRVYSRGQMTIDNSDVTATRNYKLSESDDVPFWQGVCSATGIDLIGESNGEVKQYTSIMDNAEYHYVSTDSDDEVELKAAAKPAYYGSFYNASTQGMPTAGEITEMPATGDAENVGLLAGAAAAAAASLVALGTSLRFRKRGKHEA